MKRLALILACVIILGLVTTPVFAFSPPSQGTDNATDVVLWYGDNITITSANLTGTITMANLQTAMVAAAEAHATAINTKTQTIYNSSILYIITFGIIAIAYWHRDKFLYYFAALTILFTSFSLWATDWKLSLILGAMAVYTAFKGSWERKT